MRGADSAHASAHPRNGGPASLAAIVSAAEHASPQGRLFGLYNLSLTEPTVFVEMDLCDPGNFAHRDLITIEPSAPAS